MQKETMQRLDNFMADVLATYYNNRNPFGVDGDFITAPEISQLFGEIIGIWAIQQWIRLGSPTRFHLIELGPGRGTLMADFLRGTKHIEEFHKALDIHLVETSATLKEKQRQTLGDYNVRWHSCLSEIAKDLPSIIIANEFFDALPIRQFQYDDTKWMEHYIEDKKSKWIKTAETQDISTLKPTIPSTKQDDILEYSQAQADYASLISQHKGAALIIDYGYEKSNYGDSLQALHKHKPCAITDYIGEADLTSHIDFEWLSTFFKETTLKTQGQFMADNGIAIRYHQLNNPELLSGYHRLIHPEHMGELFKALEIFNPTP